MSSSIRYRPEVDGLRAVAVLGVLLYHAGFGVGGGFVGVDVFFVISGYLITGIILRELKEDRFSMAGFWVRRIKRILPAAAVMTLATLAVGAWVLPPRELEGLGESVVWQALLSANVFFARESRGYFGTGAEYLPLLHTWSLAVEEQFYLLLPFLAVGVHRFARRWWLTILSLGCLLSLAYAAYLQPRAADAAFFLLPGRAWELGVGGVVASVRHRAPRRAWLAEALSAGGLLMIVGVMMTYERRMPFPGLYALPPVLGAALFIFGNERRTTLAGRLLSLRPLVFVGLISYSLYLWHWPALVYVNWTTVDPSPALRGAVLIVSLGVACLSWRFVEMPFRAKGVFARKRRAYGFGAGVTAATIAAGLGLVLTHGLPGRIDPSIQVYLDDMNGAGPQFHNVVPVGMYMGESYGIDPEVVPPVGNVDFILWGDSHALACSVSLDHIAREHGMTGLALTTRGTACIPGFAVISSRSVGMSPEQVLRFNDERLRIVIASGAKHVIVGMPWSSIFERTVVANPDAVNWPLDDPRWHELPYEIDGVPSRGPAPQVVQLLMQRLTDTLDEHDIKLWVLRQVPRTDYRYAARELYLARRFPWNSEPSDYHIDRERHDRQQAVADRVLRGVHGRGYELVDTADYIFLDGPTAAVYEGRSLYRDTSHLTRYGADALLGPLFEHILTQAEASHHAAREPSVGN